MKTEKQEQLTNDQSHSRAETLADLPVIDEQAGRTIGGAPSTRESDVVDIIVAAGPGSAAHIK